MSKRLLGIDVDQVLVDAPWGQWLAQRGSKEEFRDFLVTKMECSLYGRKLEYNLAKYFPSVENPMNFWRGLDYTGLPPIEGAVDCVEKLSRYFGIVFISVEKGNHGHSKYDWLAKHFPYLKGYLATREKELMSDSVVAMIDDRKKNLAGFDLHKRILFESPYKQEDEYEDVFVRAVDGWSDRTVHELCDLFL